MKKSNEWVITTVTIFVFAAITICPTGTLGQDSADFEVVFNRVHDGGPSKIASRHIYVYGQEANFEVDLLIEESKRLAAEYPDPYLLRISIFTSRDDLKRSRHFNERPVFIEFNDTLAGRKAAVEFEERIGPRSKGFYRAEYYRNKAFEILDHTPDKNSPLTKRIDLRDRDARSSTKGNASEQKEWLEYWPAVVEIKGELSIETFFGPPNFGEEPETDAKESHWILTLNEPINVRPPKDADPHADPAIENVKKLQLVLPESASELIGRQVIVKGTLFHAHTGHHHTDVLLEVETIVPAQ